MEGSPATPEQAADEPSRVRMAWRAFGSVVKPLKPFWSVLERWSKSFWKTLRLAWWPGPPERRKGDDEPPRDEPAPPKPEENEEPENEEPEDEEPEDEEDEEPEDEEPERKNDEPVPPRPTGTSEVDAAAYGAAVAHVINRPDGIRARAQVSATISAAVAAALAAFAPLTGLDQHAMLPQVLVGCAVFSWLVSLWRYILVIAFSYHDYEKETGISREPSKDIDEHMGRFLSYAAHIRAKVERGTAATTIALGFTVAAAIALATEPVYASTERDIVVSLSDEGLEAVEPVCPNACRRMDAAARPGDLTRDVVALHLSAKACGHAEDVVVHVRRAWIEAVRRND